MIHAFDGGCRPISRIVCVNLTPFLCTNGRRYRLHVYCGTHCSYVRAVQCTMHDLRFRIESTLWPGNECIIVKRMIAKCKSSNYYNRRSSCSLLLLFFLEIWINLSWECYVRHLTSERKEKPKHLWKIIIKWSLQSTIFLWVYFWFFFVQAKRFVEYNWAKLKITCHKTHLAEAPLENALHSVINWHVCVCARARERDANGRTFQIVCSLGKKMRHCVVSNPINNIWLRQREKREKNLNKTYKIITTN